MGNLIASSFPLPGGPAKLLERLQEEGLDVMRLQPSGLGPLHVFANAVDPAGVHSVRRQRAFFQQIAQVVIVEGLVNHRR